HRLPQRHIDVLAFARALTRCEGGTDRNRGVDAAVGVSVRDAYFLRRTSRIAGQRGQAAQGSDGRAVPYIFLQRTSMAIAGDRSHDDVRLDFLELLVAQPQMVHDPGSKVFDHYITL